MRKRTNITFLLFTLGIISIHAQWSKQDSLNLQKLLSGEAEIKLNQEAINDIRLETPSLINPIQLKPLMSSEKPSLKFKEDLPTFFTDSVPRKMIYLTLRPYTIFTKYDEDPIYGSNRSDYIWPMATKSYIRPTRAQEGNYRTSFPGIGGPLQGPGMGIGYSFSMEDVLQTLFSKKGRARLRNAKNANAWKTY